MPAFRTLTFDCYGTLIDWHGGVMAAAAALPSLSGADLQRLERDRERADVALGAGPYRHYREILAESLVRAAAAQGRRVPAAEARRFAESMARWAPFPDSRAALNRLAARYQLAILSNVERGVLHASVAALDAPFAALITADEVGAYKPAPAHFRAAFARLGPPETILHVACSPWHDLRPAQALGLATAFVDRDGLALEPDLAPLLVVPDLAALERALP